jgi:multisubunit Na+/H+ antiporter MnhB subunit
VDPEFKTILLRVAAIGLVLVSVSVGVLFIAFRSFGSEKPRDLRPVAWIGLLLAFVLIGCLILMRFSFVRY